MIEVIKFSQRKYYYIKIKKSTFMPFCKCQARLLIRTHGWNRTRHRKQPAPAGLWVGSILLENLLAYLSSTNFLVSFQNRQYPDSHWLQRWLKCLLLASMSMQSAEGALEGHIGSARLLIMHTYSGAAILLNHIYIVSFSRYPGYLWKSCLVILGSISVRFP